MVKELELIEQFWDLSLVSELTPSGVKLGMLTLASNILEKINEGQKADLELMDHVVFLNQGKGVDFKLNENGVLIFSDRVCVPDVPELKKRIAEFMYACLICQKSKIEHQKPSSLIQPLFVPEWKLDSISMEFFRVLPKTAKGSDSIWGDC